MPQASFLDWKPLVSAEQVFSDVVGLSEIVVDGNTVYWVELRIADKGRYVIVKRDERGEMIDITPPGYTVRSRVHEYGGGVYTVHEGIVYFVNFEDQRLYKQHGSEVIALTPEKNKDGSLGKYASLCVSEDGKTLVFVYEKEHAEKENENFIGALDLSDSSVREPTIIASGRDFYADPIFYKSEKLAWLEWNHPHMPWDSTELVSAQVDGITVSSKKIIAGGEGISVCHPKFDADGVLYFVMDEAGKEEADPKNWWNIYCYDNNTVQPVTSDLAEYGAPHWVFGQSSYSFFADNTLVATKKNKGSDELIVIDPQSKKARVVDIGYDHFAYVQVTAVGDVICIGSSAEKGPSVIRIDLADQKVEVIRKNSSITVKEMSRAELVSYPTKDGEKAYGYLSLPKNSFYTAPAEEKPPLLVLAHGGPTSNTSGAFSLIKQFWTSSGYAIMDVDYRGSTGYGRAYRDALLAKWGLIDAQDVADAVTHLAEKGLVNGSQVAIRGGSAGGYMVQRELTEYPDLFAVGASYFGIGNLITLVEQTHKFEARYIENLVGPRLSESEQEYKDRSPINHLDKLKAPMIILQGSEDKIVTPDCSREMALILKEKGILHEYIEYEGEAHGFRTKENNIDALTKEAAFYRRVFKGE